MKIAIALLLGAASSHASKVFEKADAMRVMEKMQSMAESHSFHVKEDAMRKAVGYLEHKKALSSEVKERPSRRAVTSYSYSYTSMDLPSCMDSCDMDWQSLSDRDDFCDSNCWESCEPW